MTNKDNQICENCGKIIEQHFNDGYTNWCITKGKQEAKEEFEKMISLIDTYDKDASEFKFEFLTKIKEMGEK